MNRRTQHRNTMRQIQGCRLVTIAPPDMLNRLHRLAEALCDQRAAPDIRAAFVTSELLLLCKELMDAGGKEANDAW